MEGLSQDVMATLPPEVVAFMARQAQQLADVQRQLARAAPGPAEEGSPAKKARRVSPALGQGAGGAAGNENAYEDEDSQDTESDTENNEVPSCFASELFWI